jgi:hypothetical protein
MYRLTTSILIVVIFALTGCGRGSTAIDVVPPAAGVTTVAPSTTTSTSPHVKYCGAGSPGDHGLTPCSTTASSWP